jgi:prepilin-type N-terminal cleavage/methylation domain-containing protein
MRTSLRWMGDRRGLTLVELLVALAMLAVIFGGMFASTSAMARSWATGQHRVGVQQMGRASLDWMIRRIRLAGQGYDRQWARCLPFYREATATSLKFRADVVMNMDRGVCGPFEEIGYSLSGGRLLETVTVTDGSEPQERALTVTEEVGIITVTELNFCYYDIFDQLVPDQTLSVADGQETCLRSVRDDRLQDIYRVKVRVRLVSGRQGEKPLVITSQAVRRLEVLP